MKRSTMLSIIRGTMIIGGISLVVNANMIYYVMKTREESHAIKTTLETVYNSNNLVYQLHYIEDVKGIKTVVLSDGSHAQLDTIKNEYYIVFKGIKEKLYTKTLEEAQSVIEAYIDNSEYKRGY